MKDGRSLSEGVAAVLARCCVARGRLERDSQCELRKSWDYRQTGSSLFSLSQHDPELRRPVGFLGLAG